MTIYYCTTCKYATKKKCDIEKHNNILNPCNPNKPNSTIKFLFQSEIKDEVYLDYIYNNVMDFSIKEMIEIIVSENEYKVPPLMNLIKTCMKNEKYKTISVTNIHKNMATIYKKNVLEVVEFNDVIIEYIMKKINLLMEMFHKCKLFVTEEIRNKFSLNINYYTNVSNKSFKEMLINVKFFLYNLNSNIQNPNFCSINIDEKYLNNLKSISPEEIIQELELNKIVWDNNIETLLKFIKNILKKSKQLNKFIFFLEENNKFINNETECNDSESENNSCSSKQVDDELWLDDESDLQSTNKTKFNDKSKKTDNLDIKFELVDETDNIIESYNVKTDSKNKIICNKSNNIRINSSKNNTIHVNPNNDKLLEYNNITLLLNISDKKKSIFSKMKKQGVKITKSDEIELDFD